MGITMSLSFIEAPTETKGDATIVRCCVCHRIKFNEKTWLEVSDETTRHFAQHVRGISDTYCPHCLAEFLKQMAEEQKVA